MNFSALIPCFFDHFFLVSDFRQVPCVDFLQFFPFFLHCRLCIWYFLFLEASEWSCAQYCDELKNASLLQWWDLDDVCVQLLLALVSCFRRHQQHRRIFVLRFPILRWVSPLLFIGILQGIAAGIGTSNFLRAAFIVRLNSSSFGSMKKIPLNFLALSSFGFSIVDFCFAFFVAASDIYFLHIFGHTSSGREVFLSPRKSPRTMCIHQVASRSTRWILWSLSMHQTTLFLHPRCSNLLYFSPVTHPRMCVSFW